ncbi:MAG: hypothetical protein ACLFVP_05660 [Candidatus Bathyarchaeia archaeon]
MSKQPFHIRVRIGDMEVELGGEREEVISTLEHLDSIVERVNDAFSAEADPDVRARKPRGAEDDGYPQINKVSQCSDAVEALLRTEWGDTPRTMGELREAMNANAVFFPKTTLSGVLVWMVKKGRLRRWRDEERGYLYVINEEED